MSNLIEDECNSKIQELQIAYIKKIIETKSPYKIKYNKYNIMILPGVFPPYIENHLIIDNVFLDKNDCVLDICSGSGILSIHAGLNCKKVVATDINPKAINNIILNANNYYLHHKIQTILTDVYPEEDGIMFDKILSIPPFSNRQAHSIIEKSVWDYQHHVVNKIFSELRVHLKTDGSLYLVWSSIGDLKVVFDLANKYKYKINMVASTNDEFSVYKLFKITII